MIQGPEDRKPLVLHKSIEEFLDDQPIASVRIITNELGHSRGTVFRALTQELKLRKFVSRWVPHQLSDRNKAVRVQLSAEMLRRVGDPNIEVITADESWFYHDYSPSGRWARKASDVEPRARPGIGSRRRCSQSFGVPPDFIPSMCFLLG